MGTRLSITPPRDYVLARDVCSYGYFLLAPNHWVPKHGAGALERTLALAEGPAACAIVQMPWREGKSKPTWGGDLCIAFDRGLSRTERTEAKRQIARMLRLDESEEDIAAFHAVDPRWKKSGRGRLFRSPTLFEDVLKTVTSCNVAWPSTIKMNQRLCEVVGGRSEQKGYCAYHAFPTPGTLARTRIGTLRARCSVGYRDKRIVELARMFVAGRKGGIDTEWFEDPSTPDNDIHAALLELPGIGPYAAANIMQLLGRYARLPLDTESVRHGRTILKYKGTSAQVMEKVHKHYAPFGNQAFRSYWFEMWEFYESKRGPSHTWDRETTGKTFTAAQF